jgi:hypothetical protein
MTDAKNPGEKNYTHCMHRHHDISKKTRYRHHTYYNHHQHHDVGKNTGANFIYLSLSIYRENTNTVNK